MDTITAKRLAEVRRRAEDLMMTVYELSEIIKGDTLSATDELLMNKNPDATPKLFLEYTVADNEHKHIANAYRHILVAVQELESSGQVRQDMKRGIQG